MVHPVAAMIGRLLHPRAVQLDRQVRSDGTFRVSNIGYLGDERGHPAIPAGDPHGLSAGLMKALGWAAVLIGTVRVKALRWADVSERIGGQAAGVARLAVSVI